MEYPQVDPTVYGFEAAFVDQTAFPLQCSMHQALTNVSKSLCR